MNTLEERLVKAEAMIKKPSFRKNKGLGNEVGYYVFDYEPYQELVVRKRIQELQNTNTELKFGYELIVFDLYELILQLLDEEGALEDLKDLEDEEGTQYVFDAIAETLKFEEKDSLIVNYIKDNTPKDAVVFLTGVGKCFPILRSHKILNNLHQVMDNCPVILFYPGVYTGNTLNIFGKLKDDNYYRAFPIVPR